MSLLKIKEAPCPQTYRWHEQADTKLWVLHRGTDRIGQYDMAKDIYRRVNTDGTLSDPSPRPWRTNPGVIPAPGKVVAEAVAGRSPVASTANTEPKTTKETETKKTAAAGSVERVLASAPSWSLYAAGGGLAGLVVFCGLMAHGRRR